MNHEQAINRIKNSPLYEGKDELVSNLVDAIYFVPEENLTKIIEKLEKGEERMLELLSKYSLVFENKKAQNRVKNAQKNKEKETQQEQEIIDQLEKELKNI